MMANNLAESVQAFFSNIIYRFIDSQRDTFEIDSPPFEVFQAVFILLEGRDDVGLLL
jgi:hypothetical protein